MSDRKRAVLRPSLPPLMWTVVGMWAGVWGAESATWRAFVADGSLGALTICACAAAVAAGLARRRSGSVALACAGLAAGLAIGGLYWAHWATTTQELATATGSKWAAEAITDPRVGTYGTRSDVLLGAGDARSRVSVSWPDGVAPEAGHAVEFYGSLRGVSADEYGRLAHRSGTCGSVSARMAHVQGWAGGLRGLVGPVRLSARRAIDTVPGPGGDLLAGVVLGDRRRLADTQAESDFRTTGLTHLVAVSGSHLVVVAALVAWLLGRAGTPRWATVGVVVAIVGLYVVATGVQASAVRAWLMAVVASGALLSGRRADATAGLAAACCGCLAVSPPVAFDVGFQLSVASVAGLVLFARLAETWAREGLVGPTKALAGPLALTLTAQAATLPLTTSVFGVLSLIAPVANLLAGPLVAVVLVVGLAGVVSERVAGAAGAWLLKPAGAAGALTADIAGWLAALPHASIPLGTSAGPAAAAMALVAAAVWCAWPQPTGRRAKALLVSVVLCFAALGIGPPPPKGTAIVVLDVGQGDAILVRDGPRTALIDAGPDPTALREALARQGVRRLDYLLITHLHLDHYGGAPALVGLIPVGSVLVASGAAAELPDDVASLRAPIREVQAGTRFSVGRIAVDVVSPAGPVADAATNEASVVCVARARGFSAVLTGDAEAVVLDPLVGAGTLGDIDVLKVGHHGSADAVSAYDLSVLRPEVGLVSVGEGNRFGHPVASTIGLLESSGTRVVRTDRAGDITVEFDAHGWRVRPGSRRASAGPYATMVAVARPITDPRGAADPRGIRSQTRLPDPERTGLPRAAGADSSAQARERGRRSGLQLRDLRRGERVGRCGRRGVQHAAFRLRAPPGNRAQRRQTA